jgi:uncharacterized protein YaiI (UPF0178 family)
MRILVDADACPVKSIILKHAKSMGLEVIMFIDTSHELNDGYSEVVTVDKGADSADFALIKRIATGDIVVTQDYGVAAMVLAKKALALNQNGLIYTEYNIAPLLEQRHMSAKIRRGGGRLSGNPKRTKQNDIDFEKALISLIE